MTSSNSPNPSPAPPPPPVVSAVEPPVVSAVEPPRPPRSVTKSARRRAWAEPRTRVWLLSGIVLLLIAAGCLVQESNTWRASRSILDKNTPVSAVIAAIDGVDRKGYTVSVNAADSKCTFKFTYNGQDYSVDGSIADQGDDGGAVVGRNITLHIDPADPASRWTAVTGNTSLGIQLVGFWVTFPVAVTLLALAVWQRSRVLAIWVNGREEQCVVIDTSQSALAPLSLAVRCTPVNGFDRHVATVVIPRRVNTLRAGDEIWIIFHRDQFQSAIAAACFASPDPSPAAPLPASGTNP
jgi:hypothetical protein